MTTVNLIIGFFGLLFLAGNITTLEDVFKFYTKPGYLEPNFRFLNIKGIWRILSVVVIAIGFGLVVEALLPKTTAIWTISLPRNLPNTTIFFANAVVVEEFSFRVAPLITLSIVKSWSQRAREFKQLNILTAVLTSVLFGYLHVFNYVNPDLWTYLSLINQTVSGLLFWYIMEKEGTLAGMVAHFTLNMAVWIFVAFFKP